MTDKRERIISLIRAMRERTEGRGCTEAEAATAMAKMNELMTQYQLTLDDIDEVRDDVYGALKKKYGGGSARRRTWHETRGTWGAVAQFTATECWTDGDQLAFFGSKSDCEIAFYLVDLIKNSAEMAGHARLLADLQNCHDIDYHWRSKGSMGASLFAVAARHRLNDSKVYPTLDAIFGEAT